MRSPEFTSTRSHGRRGPGRSVIAGSALVLSGAVALLFTAPPTFAIGTAVDLGTAASYSVLGGQSVSNTGPSVLAADLGVGPGSSITGFPPGTVSGAVHANDAAALQAQSDLVIAYDDAAGQPVDRSVPGELGGLVLTAGVHNASSSALVTGTLTLDAQGDPDAVFVMQIGSALTTASGSAITLVNGARSCNVFWQVGSSATLGTGSTFVGTLLVLTSVTINADATVHGRALARNGAVTLDSTRFVADPCGPTPATSSSGLPTGSVSSVTSIATTEPTTGTTGAGPGGTVGVPSVPQTSVAAPSVTAPSAGPPGVIAPPGVTGPPGTEIGGPPATGTTITGTSPPAPSTGPPDGPRPPGAAWPPPAGNGLVPPQLSLTGAPVGLPLATAAAGTILLGTGLVALGLRRRPGVPS